MSAVAPSTLGALVAGIAAGSVRVVDLTHTLTPEFPTIVMPPEIGQSAPFRMEEISRYDAKGPSWYWNNISFGEHTGTHFDAPIHWQSGRDLPNNALDTLPAGDLVAPAVVVDCAEACARDPDFLLTRDHLLRWEEQHGPVPARSWVLMRSDWYRRSGAAFANLDNEGPHTPGPDAELIRWLVTERDILGFGTETIGTDAGQAAHFSPPFPAHFHLHGAGRYGLQCLARLDELPPTGAVLLTAPLKIRNGSGSPLRVIALVEDTATRNPTDERHGDA